MGMPLEMNWLIVTKENSKRVSENVFSLEKDGYRLYPLDIPINVSKKKEDKPFATAIIRKVQWENDKTIIIYELKKLDTVN